MTSSFSVLHVIAGAGQGGAETFCLDTILALDEIGIRQYVLCRPHPSFINALTKRNIPFKTLNFSHRDWVGRRNRIIRDIVADFKPSLIHAWMGRAASFIPKGLTIPVIGWFGGYYNLKRYRRCDFYIGVTKDIVRHIIEKSGKPHRTFLVHTFGTLEPAVPLDRATLETPSHAPVVLLLSRMHWKKGIDTLLHAASLLPDVYVWLAGDGPERRAYEALSRELHLEDRVRFLGWRTDRAALIQSADVCVLPSRYEPFGTVMPESWSMRKPLVACKAQGPLQYIDHEKNGLLCAIDDAADLAMQISVALHDADKRQAIVDGGYATYNALFRKQTVIMNLLRVYATALGIGKKDRLVPVLACVSAHGDQSGMVAATYAFQPDQTGDFIGVPEDTGRMQKRKLYNFLRYNWLCKPSLCEIWTARACDQAIENFRIMGKWA